MFLRTFRPPELHKYRLHLKNIANLAGTSQEQVIRVISALKKEGLLIAKGKKIDIPNLPKIEAELSEAGYFLEG